MKRLSGAAASPTVTVAEFIASGFYSGFSPLLPGTAGTITCLVYWYLLAAAGFSHRALLLAAVIVAGLISSRLCLQALARCGKPASDPQFIVIDEWAGILIALIGVLPDQPLQILGAFLLFRFFDMLKPGPVGWAEKLPGEFGVMADDITAGFLAWLCLVLIRSFT